MFSELNNCTNVCIHISDMSGCMYLCTITSYVYVYKYIWPCIIMHPESSTDEIKYPFFHFGNLYW